jgi:hypothetical protein
MSAHPGIGLALVSLAFSPAVLADDLSWTLTPPGEANGNSGLHGTEFTPTSNITVTGLGYYDDILVGNNGLDVSHAVGIYRVSDQQLLASATVPSGTSAPKTNHFRFVSINPLTLQAGTAYVVAAICTGDWNHIVTPGSTMTASPYLSLGPWRTGGSSTLAFPSTVLSTTTRLMGPAFTFIPPLGQLAWTTTFQSSAITGSGGEDGTEFTPNTDIRITALGYYDDTYASPDGLSVSHQVGIYNVATHALVTSTTIPAGTAAAKTNLFRFVNISPVVLQACTTYVVVGVIDGDPTRLGTPGTSTMTVDAGLTIGQWRTDSSPLNFPDFVINASTRSFGPNFAFEPLTTFPDADGDQVRDCVDQCPGTLSCASVDASGCAITVPGDADRDGDVDASDIAAMRLCATRAYVPRSTNCAIFDIDNDNDVDGSDFGKVQRCFSGEGICANPLCAQ